MYCDSSCSWSCLLSGPQSMMKEDCLQINLPTHMDSCTRPRPVHLYPSMPLSPPGQTIACYSWCWQWDLCDVTSCLLQVALLWQRLLSLLLPLQRVARAVERPELWAEVLRASHTFKLLCLKALGALPHPESHILLILPPHFTTAVELRVQGPPNTGTTPVLQRKLLTYLGLTSIISIF